MLRVPILVNFNFKNVILIIETITNTNKRLSLFSGVWTAAHDYKTEWLIVKGIKGFANDNQSYNKDWKKFACVMAASVVANLLTDPVIFQDWRHFDAGITSCLSLCFLLTEKDLIFLSSCTIFLYVLQIKVAYSYLYQSKNRKY